MRDLRELFSTVVGTAERIARVAGVEFDAAALLTEQGKKTLAEAKRIRDGVARSELARRVASELRSRK